MKKEKKYLIYGIALVLVTLIGVSLSYFVAYIEGDKKQIGVSTADLKIIFNNGEAISGENIKPGWSITKTFSIENRSDDVFKYNISIEDLVNTFVTTGYLQYKITSTNGYNMTEYKDIPKSSVAKDRTLAFNIEILQGVIQEYTIEMVYRSDDGVNQSMDMGKTLSGLLYISEGSDPTLAEYIIDTYTTNNKVDKRDDFSTSFTETNDKIYVTNKTEDGSDVYYYAGNTQNNWVKFGKYQTDWYLCRSDVDSFLYTNLPTCPDGYTGEKISSAGDDMYWRIIRTNEDGGVRILYSGNDPATTVGFIGLSNYDYDYNYNYNTGGYMYGTTGSLENNRTNENSSLIKKVIDSWYRYNFYNTEYDKSISKSSIYCNDRSLSDELYGSGKRSLNYTPSYKCGDNGYGGLFESTQAIEDKFSVSTTGGGNGQLTYPISLMTADEVMFAGGTVGNEDNSSNDDTLPWFLHQAINDSRPFLSIFSAIWLNSPLQNISTNIYEGMLIGLTSPLITKFLSGNLNDYSYTVRPVITLDKCALYLSGDGTPENPYVVNSDKCKEYNYPPYDYVDPEPQRRVDHGV